MGTFGMGSSGDYEKSVPEIREIVLNPYQDLRKVLLVIPPCPCACSPFIGFCYSYDIPGFFIA